MNYTIETSDEVLWQAASYGDAHAEEILIEKYNRLVKICSRPFFLAGGDSEDLIQEGMMGLLSAIRQFDPARDTAFKTYAENCIRNRLLSAIKSASRFKHTPLNESVSFESPMFDDMAHPSGLMRDPEELIIARERLAEVNSVLSGSLSQLEKKVLEFYLSGLSYQEIADAISKTPKSIDNAVQRIRKKLAQLLNSGDISKS
ncbi:MAG: sigma-70 family RNA polymerase sigma factor [Ruminococcaceae bacterium]|nr:sigma-70 family RNA polymerase sigma factor [Oscillospiraceae bacterium]